MPDEPEAPRKDPPAGGLFDDVLKDILGDVSSELRRLTAEAAAKAEGSSKVPGGRSPTSYLSVAKTAILPPRPGGGGTGGFSPGTEEREDRDEAKTVPSLPSFRTEEPLPAPAQAPSPPSQPVEPSEARTEPAARPVPEREAPSAPPPAREEPPTVTDWEAPTQTGGRALPAGPLPPPPTGTETPLPTPSGIEEGALTPEERSVLEELMREPAIPAAGTESPSERSASEAPLGSFGEEPPPPRAEPKTVPAAAVPFSPPPPPEPSSSVPVETMIPPKPAAKPASTPALKIPDGGEDTGMLEVEDLIRMHMQGGGDDDEESEKSTQPEIDPETVLRITRKGPTWSERLDKWCADRGLAPYKRAAGIAGVSIMVLTILLALYFVRDRFFI